MTSLAPALLLYTASRLGLLAVVTGLLVVAGVPLLLAVLIGLVVVLPLSMVLLKGPRARLDAALAATGARRAAEREALRARLRGDDADRGAEGDGSDHPDLQQASERAGERQPDAGEHRPGQ